MPEESAQFQRALQELRAADEVMAAEILASFRELPWYADLDASVRAWIADLVLSEVRVVFQQLGLGRRGSPQLSFLNEPPPPGSTLNLEQLTELIRRASNLLVDLCTRMAPPNARIMMRSQVEAFLRETAFTVALTYARAAERRGASESQRHAELIAAILEDQAATVIESKASGLLPPGQPLRTVGLVPTTSASNLMSEIRWRARRISLPFAGAVNGQIMLVIVPDRMQTVLGILPREAAAAVVVGPPAASPGELPSGAREVLSSLRAIAVYRGRNRVVSTEDLLAERALIGDTTAQDQLLERCVTPLIGAGADLLTTVAAVLDENGVLEAVARSLPAHVNTVRYRLGRIVELTGRDPRRLRHALEFEIALARYRLQTRQSGNPALAVGQ